MDSSCVGLARTLFGKPLWKSLPLADIVQHVDPAVPRHGEESAQSTHSTGPGWRHWHGLGTVMNTLLKG